jgi:hypothetical protein
VPTLPDYGTNKNRDVSGPRAGQDRRPTTGPPSPRPEQVGHAVEDGRQASRCSLCGRLHRPLPVAAQRAWRRWRVPSRAAGCAATCPRASGGAAGTGRSTRSWSSVELKPYDAEPPAEERAATHPPADMELLRGGMPPSYFSGLAAVQGGRQSEARRLRPGSPLEPSTHPTLPVLTPPVQQRRIRALCRVPPYQPRFGPWCERRWGRATGRDATSSRSPARGSGEAANEDVRTSSRAAKYVALAPV